MRGRSSDGQESFAYSLILSELAITRALLQVISASVWAGKDTCLDFLGFLPGGGGDTWGFGGIVNRNYSFLAQNKDTPDLNCEA